MYSSFMTLNDTITEMVEALLFASGKAMDVEQLMTLTNSTKQKINNTLKNLSKIYDERKGALMVVEEDNSWKISVREGYLPLVRKIVADTELPKSVIETLAVIAWRSPITQSSVIKIRTNKAYEHIAELERLGFVIKQKEGRTFKLKLTEKFFDYFDISGKKDIREMFKNVKGVEQELEEEIDKKLHPDQKLLNGNKDELDEKTKEAKKNDPHPEGIKIEQNQETEVKEVKEIVNEIDKEEKEDEVVESEIEVFSEEDVKESQDDEKDIENSDNKNLEEKKEPKSKEKEQNDDSSEGKTFSEEETLDEMESTEVLETYDVEEENKQ
jgi:segregation and condensation protein B